MQNQWSGGILIISEVLNWFLLKTSNMFIKLEKWWKSCPFRQYHIASYWFRLWFMFVQYHLVETQLVKEDGRQIFWLMRPAFFLVWTLMSLTMQELEGKLCHYGTCIKLHETNIMSLNLQQSKIEQDMSNMRGSHFYYLWWIYEMCMQYFLIIYSTASQVWKFSLYRKISSSVFHHLLLSFNLWVQGIIKSLQGKMGMGRTWQLNRMPYGAQLMSMGTGCSFYHGFWE